MCVYVLGMLKYYQVNFLSYVYVQIYLAGAFFFVQLKQVDLLCRIFSQIHPGSLLVEWIVILLQILLGKLFVHEVNKSKCCVFFLLEFMKWEKIYREIW